MTKTRDFAASIHHAQKKEFCDYDNETSGLCEDWMLYNRLCESACSINEEVVAWEESEDGDYYYNENETEI